MTPVVMTLADLSDVFLQQSLIYLMFPRQLLTPHFWSDSQKAEYAYDDLLDRRYYANFLSPLSPQGVNNSGNVELSESGWRYLCGSVKKYPIMSLVKHLPVSVLQDHLLDLVEAIAEDDELLLKEGIEGLTLEECRHACLMRGLTRIDNSLIPTSASHENGQSASQYDELSAYRKSLRIWLDSPYSATLRSNRNIHNPDVIAALYAIAKPDMYLQGYKSAF
jgi:hypothetical protein